MSIVQKNLLEFFSQINKLNQTLQLLTLLTKHKKRYHKESERINQQELLSTNFN